MLRRRLERQRARGRRLARRRGRATHVHARLQDWAVDAVSWPPQNRELSGHEGEMVLNGAYLVEADRVDGLRELVGELEAHHRALGARIELTGPGRRTTSCPAAGRRRWHDDDRSSATSR